LGGIVRQRRREPGGGLRRVPAYPGLPVSMAAQSVGSAYLPDSLSWLAVCLEDVCPTYELPPRGRMFPFSPKSLRSWYMEQHHGHTHLPLLVTR
jgi:hypothetical protein